jgi:hypothetical protein
LDNYTFLELAHFSFLRTSMSAALDMQHQV